MRAKNASNTAEDLLKFKSEQAFVEQFQVRGGKSGQRRTTAVANGDRG